MIRHYTSPTGGVIFNHPYNAEYGRVCRMRDAGPSLDASAGSALAVLDESWTVIEVRQGSHGLTPTFTGDS